MTANPPESLGALAALEPAAQGILARGAKPAKLKAGQTVFSPGQACSAFLVIKAGSVRVSTATEGGRELLLYRVGPGESCILTTACLLAGQDYDATALVETDSEALVVPKPVFDQLVAESDRFRRFIFGSYGERLNGLIALVQEVSLRQVDRRLARFLIERGAGGSLAMTHQDIAMELGTAREVVSRLLKHFETDGLVRLERRRIVVSDPQRLAILQQAL